MTPLLSDAKHSQHNETRSTRSESIRKTNKRRRLLPSPSTSGSAQQEVLQVRQMTRPLANQFDVEEPTRRSRERKRKGPWNQEDLREHYKNGQISDATTKAFGTIGPEPIDSCGREDTEECQPIVYWARTGRWPEDFPTMSQEQSSSSKKRPPGSSYTQSFKDGEMPKAHSPAYEKVLAEHGIQMEELKGRSLVGPESKTLCTQFLQRTYAEPQCTTFPLTEFMLVWQLAQNRNEARVYRDITPLLVPSPELLWVGGQQELEHVAEDISAEWNRCKTLGGPKPKPDLVIGIAQSAFSEEELAKLKNHAAFERATLFTDNVYYPFLLCEAKCGDQGINRADRQNMHSSSMAVNAVIQLYRALEGNEASALSRQILVFSVSHDNERVKLYGHFAVIDGENATFYRYPVASFVLNFEENLGRKRTHDFVREIYHKFYPAHLKRIRDALAKMEDPRTLSMTSSMSIEDGESLEADVDAPSSQGTAGFKKPAVPANKKQKGEMALLREQLAEQRKQSKEQLAQLERLYKEQMAEQKEQSAQQEKQYKEQMAQQKEQTAQQEKQYKEQMAQQKEQMAQQKEQIAQQEEQYKEQIKMLKQLLDRR